jgi:hypothetical protein
MLMQITIQLGSRGESAHGSELGNGKLLFGYRLTIERFVYFYVPTTVGRSSNNCWMYVQRLLDGRPTVVGI